MPMRTRSPMLWLLLACLSGCCVPPCTPDRGAAGVRRSSFGYMDPTIAFEWAILPASAGEGLFAGTEAGWRPDAGTVRHALRGVRAHLEAQLRRTWPPEELDTEDWHATIRGILAKLDVYLCQAIGYVEEGRRLVFLNFVHRDSLVPDPDDEPGEREDWTSDPYLVDDGGDWFWQIVYDPAEDGFSSLNVNGEG